MGMQAVNEQFPVSDIVLSLSPYSQKRQVNVRIAAVPLVAIVTFSLIFVHVDQPDLVLLGWTTGWSGWKIGWVEISCNGAESNDVQYTGLY